MLSKPQSSVTQDTVDTQPSREERFLRSVCPITNGLDIFGDKWTLLIIRDLMLGKCRYQDLLSSPERVASNILADRLKKMEGVGLVSPAGLPTEACSLRIFSYGEGQGPCADIGSRCSMG